MRFVLLLSIVLGTLSSVVQSLYVGSFSSGTWIADNSNVDGKSHVRFIVALRLRDTDQMHQHLQAVSNPNSPSYGQYLTLDELSSRYSVSSSDRKKVVDYFSAIAGAKVHADGLSDMFEVTAPISSIHSHFKTELNWFSHAKGHTDAKSLRAVKPLTIPEDLHDLISFVSLNAPVSRVIPRAAKALSKRRQEPRRGAVRKVQNADNYFTAAHANADLEMINIQPGNEEALATFRPFCGLNAVTTNEENPPCATAGAANQPSIQVTVTQHANILNNTYLIQQEPTVYNVPLSSIYCYNNVTHVACNGADGAHCNCIAKIANLPKYTQLRFQVTATYVNETAVQTIGQSNLFALTDVATAGFLSELYNIPKGISVQHGSNQSVVEFYGEFYSNKDLEQFLRLSGLPNASIPVENVYGDLVNDQSDPGGEAQLDVEYIMALAPNANTFFYSFDDYNPYAPENEGFLFYLNYVANQTNPPLVHSLSYGDTMANIFNASNPGSVEYGQRCDQEFMKMGLRGLTLLFSSGDDGVGSTNIRDDPVGACQAAVPEWPTGSPYVTSVGATQMTDKYLPICGEQYTVSAAYPGMPVSNQLDFQCTGVAETVCTSTFGGVITSGGGFSDTNERATTAPWQVAAVDQYLSPANAANYPSLDYFHSTGRAYPDVATYGSNYFVYLDGKITRESGTSASAPVFAAMVTLWNDMRLAYDMPPMGFIAPFLYNIAATHPEAFQDITTGNNACGAGYSIEDVNCCKQSFAASPGWDAVTGLGSPNFNIIANLVLNNNTAFPAAGAYPLGASPSTVVYSSDDNDDSEDKAERISALVIAVVAFVLAVAALAIGVMMFCGSRGAGETTSSGASHNPMV